MKKLILVGSTGVIGSKIVELMKDNYEIITVNRSSGDYKVDMSDVNTVEKMFESIGAFDALISTSGYGKWGSLEEHSIKDFHDGINSKLMGQVNLVMIGRKYANKGASFTVSTGILAQNPVEGGLSLSLINAGLEGFVRAFAHEAKEYRINAVSPSFAKETMELMGLDSSFGVPAIEFAKLYKKSVEEDTTAKIYYAE